MQPDLPTDPSDEELSRDWLLTKQDLVEVRRCRGDDKRHSFAIQLCVLRAYGRFLGDDYGAIPVRILNYVGRQLGRPPVLFAAPPGRKETDATHERRIRAHLGFVTFDDGARAELDAWIRARAADGMLVDELVVRAEHHLLSRKVVVPSRSTIERIVNAIASRSEEGLMERIHSRLPTVLHATIDELLSVPKGAVTSLLEDLREAPPEPTTDIVNVFLQREIFLRVIDLATIDLSGLPGVTSAVVAHYAEIVRRYDAANLRRFGNPKARAMIACFLIEREKSLLDDLVTMHHAYLVGLERRAVNAYRDRLVEARRKEDDHVTTLRALAQDLRRAPGSMRVSTFRKQHVDQEQLGSAIDGAVSLERLNARGLLDAQLTRHHWLKRYLPSFLRLPFQGGAGAEPLLAAIAHARTFHLQEAHELGADAPIAFAKGYWSKALAMTKTKAGPDARVWELALAFSIDDALRRGDLFLARSRDHRSFWDFVHSPAQWQEKRDQAYVAMHLSQHADVALAALREKFDEAADAFVGGLAKNNFAGIDDDKLVLHRRDALEVSKDVHQLRRAVETHLPEIGIEDLLIEVDQRCAFTRELTPLGAYAPKVENLHPALLATLLAHGTNIGLAQMAQASRISLETLQHVSRWYLRDDTLRAANRVLVNYHHKLPLSAVWGDGSFSSSDAQRFAVEASSLIASFYPRYFGFYDRKAFMRDVYREEKRKARVHLTQLRVDLKSAREKRKQAVISARERCRAHRLEVRERLHAHRLKVLAELRETLKAERLAAREECSVDLGKARAIKDEIESSKAKVEAERTYQRKMRHLDRDHSDRLRAHKKTTARERRAESDDLVRGNIPPELVPLFERVKRGVRGSPRKSRTEEFLEWCEENPNDVVAILEEETEKKLRELEKEERKAVREMEALARREERLRPKRAKATAAELAAVPF